ncbi:hypothetical protein [Chryseobacterium koreense]|uniref:hypothetical protein n=1 Tax=Chryseobacterium koreense TaxID=232216 RepID=UPI00065AF471|nr:hypothetical protein [Chryseobacterium koreense]MBB5332095.1 hypothetical protein [Chryseobacterium koreense]
MNARVLELIKNPELFQPKDLELLTHEIEKQPYIQSLRALQLYGTHLFDAGSYNEKLSRTAAYTTDKKILYRLINKKNEPKSESSPNVETVSSETSEKQKLKSSEIKADFSESADAENFSKVEIIDEDRISAEAPLIEEPSMVSFQETPEFLPEIEASENSEVQNFEGHQFKETEDAETFATETEIDEKKLPQEIEIIENPAQLSFSGTDEFLSSVKIPPGNPVVEHFEKPKSPPNKHEIEMQRLIAEVEAKMKSAQKDRKPSAQKEEVEDQNFDVNFARTESFFVENVDEKENAEALPQEVEVLETQNSNEAEKVENSTKIEEFEQKLVEIEEETLESSEIPFQSASKEWKPMSFSGNIPDSLILEKEHVEPQKPELVESKPADSAEESLTEKVDLPVINASFFGENVAPIETDVKEVSEQSNIPVFINTWQNWLKIDRNQSKPEEKPSISITEIKNKVIDNFIEKEPKISRLKEDSNFVVKEKSDDISHLMTETLAQLYTEQKLYSKAVKAYEILSNKFPEKKSYFEDKIKEIKELRQNK